MIILFWVIMAGAVVVFIAAIVPTKAIVKAEKPTTSPGHIHEPQVEKLKSYAYRAQEELEKTKAKCNSIEKQLQKIKEKPDLSQELAEQKELLKSKEAVFKQLQKEKSELEAEIDINKNIIQDRISEDESIELEFSEKNKKLKALEKEKKEVFNKLQNVESELENFKSKKSEDISQTALAAEWAIKEKNEKVEALEKENAELSENAKNTQALIERLEKEAHNKPLQVKSSESKPTHFPTTLKRKRRKKIGEILLEHKIIKQDMLDKALENQERLGTGIAQYLLAYGYIDEEELTQCLCAQFGFPFLPLKSYNIQDEAMRLVPADIVEKYWLIPVGKREDMLTVVMVDPLDEDAIKEVEEITNCKVLPFVGFFSDIIDTLESYYKVVLKDKDKRSKKKISLFIDTKNYKGIERRQWKRLKAEIEAHLPVGGRYIKSKIEDVSRVGFSIRSQNPLPIGLCFVLEIDLPRDYDPLPIAALVRVVRTVPLENKMFEIGVKTIKILKKDFNSILEYASRDKE